MKNYKFNFVKKRTLKFEFVSRYNRLNNVTTLSKNVFYLIRSILISLIVFIIFLFSLNLILKYFFSKVNIDLKINSLEIPFFKTEKFLIIKENIYMVYSNGKKELINNNIDSKILPVITGIELNEKRPKYKSAFYQALKIKKKYLTKISEVNLTDPDNIVLITVDGKRVYMGDNITNEKMRYLYIVLEKAEKKYSYIDLRYKNMAIIK